MKARYFSLPILLVIALSPGWASALTCQHVRQLTSVYFKMHFSHNEFDDELSKRTLDGFLKAWDPGKLYFLKADVDRFTKDYSTQLDDMIEQSNCKAIDDIVSSYSQRFTERQKQLKLLIDAKHDFSVDEYLDLDRKKMSYASTTEEVGERWRKRVKFQLKQLKESLGNMDAARKKLIKRYELDAKRQNEMTNDDVYAMFLNAFAAGLDPHSDYMSPESLEDFRIQTRLSLEGIGAVLRSEDGFTRIQSLVPGGAAALTGKLKVDDKIIAVAQGAKPPVDVIDMDLREVVKLIRGTRGTEVRLTVVRDDEGKMTQQIVPVIREKVQLTDRAAKSRVQTLDGGGEAIKVGVIELPSFYMDFEGRQNKESNFTSSSADMRREIGKLKSQNVDAIVVDLRNNGGGSLDEAINVAGLFTGKGPVVQIRASDGATYVQSYKEGDAIYSGPLLVLINRQSASASEIFAGAIQDYGRGLIVGDTHTFGKGTVQNLNDLDEKLGAVKVTISKFYRPSGSSTQLRGVESDIVMADLLDEYEIGEKHYDYALPWEKIKDAGYKQMNDVTSFMPALRTASLARQEKDPGFQKVREEIKKYKEGEAERMQVSLKETPQAADEAKADKTLSKAPPDKAKKDAKKASKKDAKKAEELDEGETLPLEDDYQLQESLRISADLVRLSGKKDLVAMNIRDLKPSSDVKAVAESKKSDTKADPLKTDQLKTKNN